MAEQMHSGAVCNEAQDSAATWHVPEASAANNAGKGVEKAATAMGTRIPGVVDASTEVTRGPPLLGAAPGVCSSPAKAELKYSSSTEQDRCGNDHSKRRKLNIVDDIVLDRRRIGMSYSGPRHCYDDVQLDHMRLDRPSEMSVHSRAVRMTNTHKCVVSVVVSNDAPT